ncbi:hypothetical protein HG536_0F00570 [Torulaspora globosa]|uniref:FMP27 GFWDK domain-containing protein n=1 Tax=Torulaspora globosa TaxID=48254 RepID=A0A7G3ZJP6_9SACH|nr:uncharacterized protein HG536_0F00570 [Torulaspora globosa]QLL33732.1 hypothetical protein HG536_0F00570 [Torulaspora globosa]
MVYGEIAIRLILLSILVWIAFRVLLRFAFGVSVSYVNIFRLQIGRLAIRDVLYIGSIQFIPSDKKFLVRDVTIFHRKPGDDVSKKKRNGSSGNLSARLSSLSPRYYQWIIKFIDGLHIMCFNVKLESSQVNLATVRMHPRMVQSRNVLRVSFVMTGLAFNGDVLLEDVSLTSRCQVLTDSVGKGLPLKDLCVDLKVGDVKLPLDSLSSWQTEKKTVEAVEQLTIEERVEAGKHYLISTINQVCDSLQALTRFTASIDQISIEMIPMTSEPDLVALNEFLSLDVFVETFFLNVERIDTSVPGFKLLFREDDTPFKFNSTLSGFSVSMNVKETCNSAQLQNFKVLEVPNVSLFGSSNLLSQRFAYGESGELENAVCSIKGHISSPTVDVDVDHLSFYKCFKSNISVFKSILAPPECTRYKESYSTFLISKKITFEYFKALLPLINIKMTLEDPRLVVSDQKDFLIHKLSALMLNYETQRFNADEDDKKNQVHHAVNCSIEMIGLTSQHVVQEFDYVHTILVIDSIAWKNSIKIIPELLFAAQINVDTFTVDLSELPTMIVLNAIFKKLDSRYLDVEQNYFMDYYRKFAETLSETEKECSKIGRSLKCQKILPSELFFQELPELFDYFKIDFRQVQFTFGARSVFMPPCVFSNIDPQSSEDFVDGRLRKYCLETDKIQIALFGNRTQWHNKVETGRTTMSKSGQAGSYKHYQNEGLDDISTSEETEVQHLWNFNTLINDLSSTIISETTCANNELSARKVSKVAVLSIKVFPETSTFEADGDRYIAVQVENKRLKSVLSLMNLFLIISGVHTVKQIFGHDVCSHSRESLAKKHFMAVSQKRRKRFYHYIKWAELKNLLQFNISSELITNIFVLPNGLTARFQATSVFLTLKDLTEFSLNGQQLQLCIESPLVPNHWVRLLTVLRYNISLNADAIIEQMGSGFGSFESLSPAVILENEMWHISIPHKFELYTLIDNIPTVYKTLKQMIHSFKTSKNDCVIFPHPVKSPSLPKVKLKSKRWLFSIEDDPFEAELNMICQIGLEEQKSRLAKLEEFERRTAAEVLKQTQSKVSESQKMASIKVSDIIQRIRALKRRFHLKASNSLTHPDHKNDMNINEEKVEEHEIFISSEIEDAYNRLLENFSTSWINRIMHYKQKEKDEYDKNFPFLWGEFDTTTLPEDFNHRVLPFRTHPFLANLIVEGIDVDIFQPSFGIDGIADFIHEVGKGAPKDAEYTIMLPMYFNFKFTELRWHLKDYPLPLVYIPPLGMTQVGISGNHFHGDLIIAEDMIRSSNEVREVFVPLVPSSDGGKDSYYSITVPRTLTSAKLYTKLDFDIYSNGTTQVTWGGGYQPAIQQTMQCLDNFSKPPIDPSPKLGFWDKLRYIFHARVKVSWKKKGKFDVCLKGGKSPYKIGPDAAGFILGFAENVMLDCNEKDDPLDFLSCKADTVHFSTPNHFARPLLVWSRPSDQTVFIPSHDNTNLQQHASFYYLLDLEKTTKEASERATMASRYIEKTGISLAGGVLLKVGIVLERLIKGSLERSRSFKPHYEARLCNPRAVPDPDKHDSYAKFRSHFIHMSFLLLSRSDSAYNTMQLSPASIHLFMNWWRSFAGNLPVRRGQLFGFQSISPKFGEHLCTISYHADVSPLYITHLAHSIHNSHELRKSNRETIEFSGLKAKTDNFVMDLHQRKEVMLKYQEGLDKTKKIMSLKLLEGDISTVELDIRAIEASFRLAKFIEEKAEAKFNIPDGDMSWYDPSDFKEVNFIDIENYVPDLKMVRLLYARQFMYLRRAAYGDTFQVDPATHKRIVPFKNNLSHKCVLGEPLKLPFVSLKKRRDLLIKHKKSLEEKIHSPEGRSNIELLKHNLEESDRAICGVDQMLEDCNSLNKLAMGFDKSEVEFNYPFVEKLQSSVISAREFENRYHVCGMLLRWNEDTRNIVFKYLHYRSLTRQFASLTEQHCLKIISKIINSETSHQENESQSSKLDFNRGTQFAEDLNNATEETVNKILEDIFNNGISKLGSDTEYAVQHNHIVQFINPQIQLISDKAADTCLVVTTPTIMLKVLSFGVERAKYDDDVFLRRYGIHFTKANVFHFSKSDYEFDDQDLLEMDFAIDGYGQDKGVQWPPWLSINLCLEPTALASNAIMKDLSAVVIYDNASQFTNVYALKQGNFKDTVSVYIPKIILTSDSKRYMTLYSMITNLLIYMEPENAELRKQIEKWTLGYYPEDVSQMHRLVSEIHRNLKMLSDIENEFSFRRPILDEADKMEFDTVRNERADNLLRLYILMRVFSSGLGPAENQSRTLLWNAHLKETIFHMLESDSSPFVDVAVAKLHFQREESSNGFNKSSITAEMAQVFHLQRNATYKNVLGPYIPNNRYSKSDEHLIKISWVMNRPIGGIKVIKHAETNLADFSLGLEEETINRLIAWLVPKEDLSMKMNGQKEQQEQADVESAYDVELADDYMNFSGEKGPDLREMVQRSGVFFIIENITINSFLLCISFRGRGAKRMINVTDFMFHFPKLTFENQTMRLIDLFMHLRKMILKDIIRHAVKFLETKVRNHPPKLTDDMPLKQLSRYESYTHAEDLQD